MSLDVYLQTAKCPTCAHCEELYSSNITSNLAEMATALAIYNVVWRPSENGISCAEQLVIPLTAAVSELRRDPNKYSKFNAPNGWGTVEHFLNFLERYLEACIKYPEAEVLADC